jgi:hypothetical protein
MGSYISQLRRCCISAHVDHQLKQCLPRLENVHRYIRKQIFRLDKQASNRSIPEPTVDNTWQLASAVAVGELGSKLYDFDVVGIPHYSLNALLS